MCFLAYVDPGSGHLLWQMLVAAAVGALFYIRQFREFLGRMAAKLTKKKIHKP